MWRGRATYDFKIHSRCLKQTIVNHQLLFHTFLSKKWNILNWEFFIKVTFVTIGTQSKIVIFLFNFKRFSQNCKYWITSILCSKNVRGHELYSTVEKSVGLISSSEWSVSAYLAFCSHRKKMKPEEVTQKNFRI